MKTETLRQQHKQLSVLITKTQTAGSAEIELQSHWAKYICVLTAGFLENALRETYKRYVSKRSPEPVSRYAASVLDRVQNPKASKFIEVAGAFKKSWGEDITVFLDANNRKDAIDSIMNNRHQIAHGKQSNVTITQVSTWLEKSKEVVEYIEVQCR
jgi:hypothetical protein